MLYVFHNGSHSSVTRQLCAHITDLDVVPVELAGFTAFKNRFVKMLCVIETFIPFLRFGFLNFTAQEKQFFATITPKDSVLCMCSSYPPLLGYLYRHSHAARYCIWESNTVAVKGEWWNAFKNKRLQKHFEVCTFDAGDAKKLGYTLMHQVWFRDNAEYAGAQSDVYFVGADKGRFETIERIAATFAQNGISCNFSVLKESGFEYPAQSHVRLIERESSDAENMGGIKNTRCLLEITKQGQAGMTLRPLDAFFNGQGRLLTTSASVFENYPDICNGTNTFVYDGQFDVAQFKRFLGSEPHIDKAALEQYEVNTWIQQFK